MIGVMPQMVGEMGCSTRGREMRLPTPCCNPALHQRIAGEIENRRQDWVNGRDIRVLPNVRYGLRDRLSQRNVERNYNQYFNQGMGRLKVPSTTH